MHNVTRALPGVPVIGTGGVQSGVDAVEMLLAGASAVGVGTANFRDPRAPYRVLDELRDWCARHDVARVRDLTGALEVPMNDDPRDHLALALDVGDLDAALAVAQRVQPWFGVAKVGFELYAEVGPAAFDALQDMGFRVFADLKLHDIPNTVERAARVLGRRGVDFLNFHAAGGEEMLRAGVDGLARGCARRGRATCPSRSRSPCSRATRTSTRSTRACDVARDAGCDGVVCAGPTSKSLAAYGLRTMVPGIRLAGGATHDQARVDTPVTRSRAVRTGW